MGKNAPYTISIIGLGYVGLPLARLFIEKGHTVYGIDVDENKITQLMKRQSYLSDFSRSEVKELFAKNSFHVGSSFEIIQKTDAVIICVPTPLDASDQPDLKYVINAMKSLLPYLHTGQLVVLESSTYPGTVEEELQPLIESRGLIIGKDVSLAYSPERIDPGGKWILRNIPKVVGGVTPACTEFAKNVYASVFSQVVVVSSPKVAEMTKLIENSQRFINITFINSLLPICEKMNISLWEAIEAAATKPYGFTPYYPGPGIGGHCIPVDPLYLTWKAKQYQIDLPFIELSHRINEEMPDYIVKRVENELKPRSLAGSNILVIGVTYKKDVNDIRESSALQIIEKLMQSEAKVGFHDPYVEELTIGSSHLTSTPLTSRNMKHYDCTIILTDHSNIPYDQLVSHSTLVIDTRNATSKLADRSNVILL